MPRLPLISALALFAAAAALASTSTYRDRRKALTDEAQAQRKQLGLEDDRVKLFAQYPTPEVTFQGEPSKLGCGGTAEVRVSGKFPRGTSFLVSDDEVELIEARSSAEGWQAKLKAAPAAAPADVNLHVIAPVSDAEKSTRIAQVRGRYALDLRFEDGWTAHFDTANADAGRLAGAISWKKGESQRTGRAQVDFHGGRIRIRQEPSAEDGKLMQEQVARLAETAPEEAVQRVMARVQECMSQEEPARSSCAQKAQAENAKDMDQIKKQQEAIAADYEARRPKEAWNCSEVLLDAQAGALAGTATCPPRERKEKVEGTLRCTPASAQE